jgi:small-conductance mechanosensitive channel
VGLDFWICLLTISGAIIGAGVPALVIAGLVNRFARRHGWCWMQVEIGFCRRPWVATAGTVAAAVVVQRFSAIGTDWRRSAWIPVIVAACWLLIHGARVAEAVLLHRLPVGAEDNHRIRRARTRVAMLRRLVAVAAGALGLAGSLMLLPGLPAVGASLFASAGLAGIVAGLAAQASLANVFAGMQLAFTDAVRIDDVVVVEGEWGWIEEITLTYVVLHIWDERRLVLPTSYFTTMPFQNWTRHQAQLLGSVILHLDYAAPLTALREYARLVIEASPLWDRQDWVLQVTSTTETTMVVRVLASAKDGPTSWDLCCDVREALLVFLQERHPQALPVHRLLSVTGRSTSSGPRAGEDSRAPAEIQDHEYHRDATPGTDVGIKRDGGMNPHQAKIPHRRDTRRADLRRAERSAARSAPVPPPRRARVLRGPR